MTTIPLQVSSDVYLDDLMHYFSVQLSQDELIGMVVSLDDKVGSLEFTSRLYAALGDVLREEMDCE